MTYRTNPSLANNIITIKKKKMENQNEPIYPIVASYSDDDPQILVPQYLGLTKREYFTGLAMQGMLAASENVEYGDYGKTRKLGASELAQNAVQQADALLSALNPKPQ